MNYQISRRNDATPGDGTAGEILGTSDHLGAKAVRKHYQSAIRQILEAEGEVAVLVHGKTDAIEFTISKEES